MLAFSGFVQVDELVLDLFEKARKAKYPATRADIMSFGRAAKKTLLDGNKVLDGEREKLEGQPVLIVRRCSTFNMPTSYQ